MKNWQAIAIILFSIGLGSIGWFRSALQKPEPVEVRVSATEHETPAKVLVRPTQPKVEQVITNADGLRLDADGFVIEEDDGIAEMSELLRSVYAEFCKSRGEMDSRQETLALIDKLLAASRNGATLPRSVKRDILQSLSGYGLDGLEYVIGLMADSDFDIADEANEALKSILWDLDATPQQIADALANIIKLTTSYDVIDPFIQEMSDWPAALKVQTALSILDSGNATAIKTFDENKNFIFGDFDGKIQTREDIVAYGEEIAAQEERDAAAEAAADAAQSAKQEENK